MPTIYTIGYEGATVEQLVQTLKNLNIEVLADVRELPLSRKKGLSKNGLSANVSKVGIEYRHIRELGDPKAAGMLPSLATMQSSREFLAITFQVKHHNRPLRLYSRLRNKKLRALCVSNAVPTFAIAPSLPITPSLKVSMFTICCPIELKSTS